MLDVIHRAHQNIAEYLCLSREPLSSIESSFSAINEVNSAIEENAARTLGIDPRDAFILRRRLLIADDERIRNNCFNSPIDAGEYLLSKFPMTPDIGLELPNHSLLQAFGNCGPAAAAGRGHSGNRRERGFDINAVQTCRDNFISAYSDCDNPAADGPSNQEEIEDAAEQAQADIDALCEQDADRCERSSTSNDDGTRRTDSTIHTGENEEKRKITVNYLSVTLRQPRHARCHGRWSAGF